jgi:prepilin-type N-terminal cleavage/methylation domain-containing protein
VPWWQKKMKKAFTLIELVVAVALLAIVFAFAGTIFKVSISSYRTAVANAEIMQKLRAITDQMNADFKGLRKDGEIFVIWKAEPNSHERFDRIMFFADGDFQSYEPYKGGKPDRSGDPIRGNVARICYMLGNKRPANIGDPIEERPYGGQKPEKRILARTQHILTADAQFAGSQAPSSELDWYNWNDIFEYDYDMNSLDKWKDVLWQNKKDMLSVITDVNVDYSTIYPNIRGTMVDPADANLIHNLLCEGVGEFKVQGWYDAEKRWVPEFDSRDFDGLPTDRVPGVLYPYPPYGTVILGGDFYGNNSQELLNEAKFDSIPGLGRALKFTFTLYDSKGVIKEGRTFTHIVYLGN